jgi:hypothetical protein
MIPDTKKIICELAGVDWEPSCENIACTFCEGFDDERQCCGDMEITLNILMRAVFAINRGDGMYQINLVFEHFNVYVDGNVRHFFYKDHNNSYSVKKCLHKDINFFSPNLDKLTDT